MTKSARQQIATALYDLIVLPAIHMPSLPVSAYVSAEYKPCRMSGSLVDQCEPKDAEFWSVYLRLAPDKVTGFMLPECIGDFATEGEAKLYCEIWGNTVHQAQFSFNELDAAMCLWEAYIAAKAFNMFPAINAMANHQGACETRNAVGRLGVETEALYLQLTDEEKESHRACPFDWEFCPLICSLLTYDGESLDMPSLETVRAELSK